MNTPGLMLSPKMAKGFRFVIMDVSHTEGDRVIELNAPEDLHDIAALLRDPERFVVESVWSRGTGAQAAAVSTTRLHNIAGKYTGKDDPVMIFRTQGIFPAPEEVIAPYSICPYVTGDCRGSHTMTLMPMPANAAVRGEYCQPIVSCLAFSMSKGGKFTKDYIDLFAGQEWDEARKKALRKSEMMREQGFFGVAMAPESEIAYTGLTDMLKELDNKFKLRKNPE